MTVDEITTQVRLVTLIDTGDVSDGAILTLINDCIYHISQMVDAPWLEDEETLTTIASTQAYALTGFTAEVEQITKIRQPSVKRTLIPISSVTAYDIWGDNVSSSTPKYYYIEQENINLVPIPDAVLVYKVQFIKAPAVLTAGADTPAWLTSFHNIVVDYVVARLWEREEDFQKAAFTQQKFDQRLRAMMQTYKSRAGNASWVVGAGSGVRGGGNTPFLDGP